MATILAFRTPNTSPGAGEAAPASPKQRKSAELIFFPGVRYERAEPATAPSSRRSRRAKPHELIDMMD